MSPPDITFNCPEDMKYWSGLVFSGEYDLTYAPETPPRILDIGANCGAFSLWALSRWPGSKITAYEPQQIAFRYLFENTSDFTADITIVRAAVLSGSETKLYVGAQNNGQATFYPEVNPDADGTYELPPVVRPDSLPPCDILKIDTEGAEVEIIIAYLATGKQPNVILFEYHRESDRISLTSYLRTDYILVGAAASQAHRGVLKYVRRAA